MILFLSSCEKSPVQPAAEDVRAYILAHPEVVREVAVATGNGAKGVQPGGERRDLRTALEGDLRDFVANPHGRITVVEFFDYRCGYCKASAPEVVRLIAGNPDVRFVFKELPVFGGVSDVASRVALSEPVKDKGLALYAALMAEKALDEGAIRRVLVRLKIDPDQAAVAAQSPTIQAHLDDTRALAEALQLKGTPTFIVQGKIIRGADMEAVRSAISEAKKRSGV